MGLVSAGSDSLARWFWGQRMESPTEGGAPHPVPRVEALDLVQLDIGVLGPVHGSAGNPPLRARQARGQVCASSGGVSLLRPTRLGDEFAVRRLPAGKQVHIAAGPVTHPVSRDRVPAGQRKPVPRACREGDPRYLLVPRLHRQPVTRSR
jgi:hypothetical protein